MAWSWQKAKKSESDGSTQPTLSEGTVRESATTEHASEPIRLREDEAIRAHCLRVATWSGELASAAGLSESERSLVEQAAIAHHVPDLVLNDQARERLLADLHVASEGDQSYITAEVRAVIETLRGRRPIIDSSIGKMIAVLEISNDFDQFFESEPLFDSETADPCTNSSVEAMMTYLQVTSRADITRVVERLPVFPRAAREVVRQLANPDAGPREMEAVASLDPVLAGRLIQTANSAYYSPRSPIATIFQAVNFVGTETARRVLLAAALRGNFSSPQSHQLWNHSLDVAQTAELAAIHSSVTIDPSLAFLSGLIHDVGRLAFTMMPAAFQERFHRLTDGGCPAVQVEMCLSGRCHGDVGSETLTQWKFPLEVIEAVRWHHRPECSQLPLTSLLYLAEFVTESQEDLPSYVRMQTATRIAGISVTSLAELRSKLAGSLSSLQFAA